MNDCSSSNSYPGIGLDSPFAYTYTDIEISHAASLAHPKSAIQIRNREMVDRADMIVCYIEHEKGGSWQTVQYAMEQGKTVINLANDDETVNLL